MRRQTLKTAAIAQGVEACFRQYPAGLVPNVQKGAVPSQSQSVARSVATDVGSPPSAGRRIARYEGARVTSHYRSHRTERVEHDTVAVTTFIGRRMQHTVPQGLQRIREYGVPATTPFAKVQVLRQAALAKVEGVIKGAVKMSARLGLSAAVSAEHGAGPLTLSARSGREGVVAPLAPDLWGDP